MKKLIVFDLDGTLVKGQSQRLFLAYLHRLGIIGQAPLARLYAWFALRKMGIATNPEGIMNYGFSLFANWRADIIEVLVKDFFQEKLQEAIYQDARSLVATHNPENCELMLVSNAFDGIVKHAAVHLGIGTAIGTRLELNGRRFTGRIRGVPVFGANKAEIVRAYAEANGFSLSGSWAYGDSYSDLPVLEMVENPVAVNPDRKLCREARRREWPIIQFEE